MTARLSVFVRAVALGSVIAALLAAPGVAAAQRGGPGAGPPDLKAPQPERDAAGRPIPGHFTVTICK